MLKKFIKHSVKKFSLKGVNSSQLGMIHLSNSDIQVIHEIILGITDDIYEVCKENNLHFMLGGGSALGAVRHKGFIPWDDDMDLNMTRHDIEIFIPKFIEKYSDKYWIHSPMTRPDLGNMYCRIRKKGTLLKTGEDIINTDEAGVFVDMFIIENIYNNPVKRTLHGYLCTLSKLCLASRRFYIECSILKKENPETNMYRMSVVRTVIGFLCGFMSLSSWTRLTDKIASMCKDNNSNTVCIPAGRWHYFGSMHDRNFCNVHEVPFEDRMYPVTDDVSDYLTNHYGSNYMQIPPESKREIHSCWKFDPGAVLNTMEDQIYDK